MTRVLLKRLLTVDQGGILIGAQDNKETGRPLTADDTLHPSLVDHLQSGPLNAITEDALRSYHEMIKSRP
jgi:hypothetical protein